MSLITAFRKSFFALFTPGLFIRALLPSLIAFLLWLGLLIVVWTDVVSFGIEFLVGTSPFIWLTQYVGDIQTVARLLTMGFLIFLSVPILFIFSFIISAFFLAPVLVKYIHQKDYPQLKTREGHLFFPSFINSVKAFLVYFVLLVLTAPLMLVPGLQIIIPILINGYLLQKVLAFDIWNDFLNRDQIVKIKEKEGANLFVLGIMAMMLFYLPLINFFAPALSTLVFVYYCLGAIEEAQ